MKKLLYIFLLLVPFLASCNSNDNFYTLTAPSDQMHLKASSDSIVLEKAYQDSTAIKFTWSDATNRGSDTQLTYYFRLYMADATSNVSELIELSDSTHSISYTNRQINDLLSFWGIDPGENVTLVGEVIAKVTASKVYMKPEISTATFKATGYNPKDVMYLKVKTTSGSNLTISMDTTSVTGVYQWTGTLVPGEYWFSTDATNGVPAYVKGANDSTVVYSKTGEGTYFTNATSTTCTITLNLNTSRVSITPSLYMITSLGGVESTQQMSVIDYEENYFHWTGTLQAGTQIRFAKGTSSTWPAYVPDPTDASKLVSADSGAAMLTIPTTGKYEIVLSLDTQKLICLSVYDLKYSGIWGTGTALSLGSLSLRTYAYAFQQPDIKNHPEIWTLTTYIVAGGKLELLTRPASWYHSIVGATSNLDPCNTEVDCGVTAETVSYTSSHDNAFIPQTSGIWTIKVDLHNMKLILVQE